jgi:hypothetical protein
MNDHVLTLAARIICGTDTTTARHTVKVQASMSGYLDVTVFNAQDEEVGSVMADVSDWVLLLLRESLRTDQK